MAGKKQTDETSAQTYGRDELIAYADELFGVMPEALQGALYGTDAAAVFTIEDARTLVDQFMNRKVN